MIIVFVLIILEGAITIHNISLTSTLRDQIIAAQRDDIGMGHLRKRLHEGEPLCFREDADGVLWFKDRLVVPRDYELRRRIMNEAHNSKFSIHPGITKMYQDLKQLFWWTRMKREIARYVSECDTRYVSECDTCQQVKTDHLKPSGLLQPLPVA